MDKEALEKLWNMGVKFSIIISHSKVIFNGFTYKRRYFQSSSKHDTCPNQTRTTDTSRRRRPVINLSARAPPVSSTVQRHLSYTKQLCKFPHQLTRYTSKRETRMKYMVTTSRSCSSCIYSRWVWCQKRFIAILMYPVAGDRSCDDASRQEC